MTDLISRMNDLREEMLRKKVPENLQHECIENLIASYQELPNLRSEVQNPQYGELMKEKCQKAYSQTLEYLEKRLGEKSG